MYIFTKRDLAQTWPMRFERNNKKDHVSQWNSKSFDWTKDDLTLLDWR